MREISDCWDFLSKFPPIGIYFAIRVTRFVILWLCNLWWIEGFVFEMKYRCVTSETWRSSVFENLLNGKLYSKRTIRAFLKSYKLCICENCDAIESLCFKISDEKVNGTFRINCFRARATVFATFDSKSLSSMLDCFSPAIDCNHSARRTRRYFNTL